MVLLLAGGGLSNKEELSRNQIKAIRAKEDADEATGRPKERAWDRDARGKRPWQTSLANVLGMSAGTTRSEAASLSSCALLRYQIATAFMSSAGCSGLLRNRACEGISVT
jgi:hypothetical protein